MELTSNESSVKSLSYNTLMIILNYREDIILVGNQYFLYVFHHSWNLIMVTIFDMLLLDGDILLLSVQISPWSSGEFCFSGVGGLCTHKHAYMK